MRILCNTRTTKCDIQKNLWKQVHTFLLFCVFTLCDMQKCVLHAKCTENLKVCSFFVSSTRMLQYVYFIIRSENAILFVQEK